MSLLKNMRDLFSCNLNRAKGNVKIGNILFTFQYRVGFLICECLAVYLLAFKNFASPLECSGVNPDYDAIDHGKMCWSSGLYSPDKFERPGTEMTKLQDYSSSFAVIFAQGFLFLCPYFLWKNLEGKKIKYLQNAINSITPKNKDETEEQQHLISTSVEYFKLEYGKRNLYFICYIFCDSLNAVNICGQILFTHWYLGRRFLFYSIEYYDQYFDSPFPLQGYCKLRFNYGVGPIQHYSMICSINLNRENGYAYLVLWYSFCVLGIAAAASFARNVILLIPCSFLRATLWKLSSPNVLPFTTMKKICQSKIGDSFTIMQLSKNMPHHAYLAFLKQLHNEVEMKMVTTRDLGHEM